MNVRAAILIVALAIAGCGLDDRLPPSADVAARRAEDRAADRLRIHARALPGVADVTVAVALPVIDPLARAAAAAPPRAAIAVTVAAGSDAAAIRAAVLAAGRAVLGPDAAIDVDLLPTPPPPRRSRTRAIAITAAIGVLALAAAIALARRRAYRARGTSPQ